MIRHGGDAAARNPVTSIAVIKCSFRVFKKAHTFCQHFLCANRVDSAWKPFPRNVESRAQISIFEKVYVINGINLIFSLCYTLARGDTMLKSGSELLRRGYDVSIGKVGSREVDFIAANAAEKRYIQVTESMKRAGHPGAGISSSAHDPGQLREDCDCRKLRSPHHRRRDQDHSADRFSFGYLTGVPRHFYELLTMNPILRMTASAKNRRRCFRLCNNLISRPSVV